MTKPDWKDVLGTEEQEEPKAKAEPGLPQKAKEAVRKNGARLVKAVRRPFADWHLFRTLVLSILAGAIIWQAIIGWGPAVTDAIYSGARGVRNWTAAQGEKVHQARLRRHRDGEFKKAADAVERETWIEVIAYRWDEHKFTYGTREGTTAKHLVTTARWAITSNDAERRELSEEEALAQFYGGLNLLMARSACATCINADRVYIAELRLLTTAPRSGEEIYETVMDFTLEYKAIARFLSGDTSTDAAVAFWQKHWDIRRYNWLMIMRQRYGPLVFEGKGWTWH